MMHKILLFILALILACMFWCIQSTTAHADGMKVLPKWTMRQCPKEQYATYDFESAKTLKMRDSDCWYWSTQVSKLKKQTEDWSTANGKLKEQAVIDAELHRLADKRIQDLLKQVKDEVAEKNKYKYKSDYKWVWITVGAAVAAVGVAFGAGVWVAKR